MSRIKIRFDGFGPTVEAGLVGFVPTVSLNTLMKVLDIAAKPEYLQKVVPAEEAEVLIK